ncbi:MAG: ABC transporter substrate-binding protein, partial [Acidimicrobiales bacterium]
MSKHRKAGIGAGALAVVAGLSACGSTGVASASTKSVDWSKATSAQAGGGMAALIKAAKKEGQLNVIALPPGWANYGQLISTFEKKYGIKINSQNPDGSSAEELAALKSEAGTSREPDVVDVGPSFA